MFGDIELVEKELVEKELVKKSCFWGWVLVDGCWWMGAGGWVYLFWN